MENGLVNAISGWFKQPFKGGQQMTAFQWVLIVGLVIVSAYLWQLVILEVARD